jgi:hypothetical protein
MDSSNENHLLDIPEDNREIALHLRAIRYSLTLIEQRLTNVEKEVEGLKDRRFKLQDIFISSLILPLVGGMMLFLLTKALG